MCVAQPLAEQYKFIVIAPECANPAKYVSWVVVDASQPASLDMQHAQVCTRSGSGIKALND